MKLCVVSQSWSVIVLLWWSTTTSDSFTFPLKNARANKPFRRLTRCDDVSYRSIELQPSIPISSLTKSPVGITSAVPLPCSSSDRWVALGTKYGDLVLVPFRYDDITGWQLSPRCSAKWMRPSVSSSNITLSIPPLPIYSLATALFSNENGTDCQLLSGGADRYVSIWKTKDYFKGDASLCFRGNWETVQRLGPHTGWVKSLILANGRNDIAAMQRYRLYSIGCNRIERWFCNDDRRGILGGNGSGSSGAWMQSGTFSVESSPTNLSATGDSGAPVCTLSSDLLCLELCTIALPSLTELVVVAAGGVDGRIHFFLDADTSMSPRTDSIATVVGHQGRVNTLSFDKKSQLLFSGSHDGFVHCWQLSFNNGFGISPEDLQSQKLAVFLVASYHFTAAARVTVLLCINTKEMGGKAADSIDVLVGTQNGQIHLLSLLNRHPHTFSHCAHLNVSDVVESEMNSKKKETAPIINAFSCLNDNDYKSRGRSVPLAIVVGHSKGLGLVSLASKEQHYS